MTTLNASVGLRELKQKVSSRKRDQEAILRLLGLIKVRDGGQLEIFAVFPIEPGENGECPEALAQAIFDFQTHWVRQGEFRRADGVVDPNGTTLKKMDALVKATPVGPVKPEIEPDQVEIDGIILRQANPPALAAIHEVSNPVVEPLSVALPLLAQKPLVTRIHELRIQVVKPDGTFWVGVAVPEGTTDFTRAHLFFHPTPIQAGQVRAADRDYPKFVGGWPTRIQRYMPRNGGQMAGARKIPLLVPYMTMASAKMDPKFNVFADRPQATLNAILTFAQQIILSDKSATVELRALSTSSFSSGVTFHAAFLELTKSMGLVVEVMDFDSTFIISKHEKVSGPAGGGNFLQFTQFDTIRKLPGRFDLPPRVWVKTKMTGQDGKPVSVHGKIGFMMFLTAMTLSILV
jgi:hypothetical protein